MSSTERILIVEDNNIQRIVIYETLRNAYPDWVIVSVSGYDEAESEIKNSLSGDPFSLFLLDVQLSINKSDRGGFVLANLIRKQAEYFQTPILFLTAVSDEALYALSNFHCYNYISKPYTPIDLLDQIEQMKITGYLKDYLVIRDSRRITHHVNPDDIYMLNTSSHVLHIHTLSGVIDTREYTLDSIMPGLPSCFKRCHKKYIVNSNFVKSLDVTRKVLSVNTETIPVSIAYINALK